MMKGCEDICAAFVFVLFRQIKFTPVTFQMFSENLYPAYPFSGITAVRACPLGKYVV